MSLYVVYTTFTGHVVGAVNGIGGTPPGTDAAALVGDALPLRLSLPSGEIATFLLPAGELAALAAEDEPGVFTGPLSFGVEQVPESDPKPALVPLRSSADIELKFTQNSLLVTIPTDNGSVPANVLGMVSVDQEVRTDRAEIASGGDTAELALAVPDGTHGVLVLVAGWAGTLTAVTKP